MSISKRNHEGYPDLTPYEAIKNIDRKAKYCPSESEEQIALFEWAALNERKYPELKLMYHVPNGGLRNKVTAARLKREGAKAGVPDLVLPAQRHGYGGMYIELKKRTGRITTNQAEWLNALKQNGYYAVVAYGFEEARNFVEWYLSGEKRTVNP